MCVIIAKGNCVPLLAGSNLSSSGLVCDQQEFRACPVFKEINSSWCKRALKYLLQKNTQNQGQQPETSLWDDGVVTSNQSLHFKDNF